MINKRNRDCKITNLQNAFNKRKKCGISETLVWTRFSGSYTVEAAMVLPLFVSFMVVCIFVMKIFVIKTGVQRAMDITTSQMACVAIDKEEDLNVLAVAAVCDANILQEDIPLRFLLGDIAGISYINSDTSGNYIDLEVDYYVTFPLKIFGRKGVHINQVSSARKWVGYDPTEKESGEIYVYVTEHGEVYHTSLSCPYLNPSVRAIDASTIKDCRSKGGGKYEACKYCRPKKGDYSIYYITDYGDAYHCRLDCGALKRNIKRVKLEDVEGMEMCSKCGGKN
ncbi:MAG: pilus assembly protein [Lachnospiraceae bacterium]|nr:pilus assembly protein [Lachnospiraceae bacterium]